MAGPSNWLDFDDGDRLIDILGLIIGGFLLLGVGVLLFSVVLSPPTDAGSPPAANWTLERVNDSYVQVGHAGGEPVPAAELVVTVDGIQRRVTWSGVVTEGDAGVVRAPDDVVVRLYWETEVGELVKLAEWNV